MFAGSRGDMFSVPTDSLRIASMPVPANGRMREDQDLKRKPARCWREGETRKPRWLGDGRIGPISTESSAAVVSKIDASVPISLDTTVLNKGARASNTKRLDCGGRQNRRSPSESLFLGVDPSHDLELMVRIHRNSDYLDFFCSTSDQY